MKADFFDSIFDGALANIQNKALDAIAGFDEWFFLGKWGAAVILFLVVAGFIARFVPFQWLRSLLGFLGALGVAWWLGMLMMFTRNRVDTQRYRDQIKELKSHKEDQQQPKSWW